MTVADAGEQADASGGRELDAERAPEDSEHPASEAAREEETADASVSRAIGYAHEAPLNTRQHHSRCKRIRSRVRVCRQSGSIAGPAHVRCPCLSPGSRRWASAREGPSPRKSSRWSPHLPYGTHVLVVSDLLGTHDQCTCHVKHKRTAAAWLRAVRRCECVISTLVGSLAGRVGFEPTWVFRPNSFSRRARSTALSPPRGGDTRAADWRPLPVWRLWGDSNARPLPPQGSALIH